MERAAAEELGPAAARRRSCRASQGSPYPGVARSRFGALPPRALKSQGIVFN